MPIYEYVCVDCNQKFEMRRSFNQADDPATCPECGGQHVRRLLSTFVAFSSDGGTRTAVAGAGSACSTCAATSCAACGIARQ